MGPPEALLAVIGVAVVLYLLVGRFPDSVRFTHPARFKGQVGEARVNAGLRLRLDGKVYRVLTDLTLSIGDRTVQIDHLVVSRYGIFVIETKNLTGWIFGSPDRADWTQVIYGHRNRFRNPLRQSEAHVRAVHAILGVERELVFNAVVFVGDSTFRTPMPPEVVEGVSALSRFIESKRTPVFADYELPRFVERLLKQRLAPGSETDRAHLLNVERARRKREAAAGNCPRCGGGMVERTNSRSGERFLGCRRYPACNGTRPIA